MGFLFLLFGYFFLADFQLGIQTANVRFDMLPDVLGWVLLFVGCWIAARYSKKLSVARWIACVMILPALFDLLFLLGVWTGFGAQTVYTHIYPYFAPVVSVLFHYYLLFGLHDIAKLCGDQETLARKLRRNFFLTLVCLLLVILARILLAFFSQLNAYCALISAFCTMIYLASNAWQIFQCFRRITVE